MSMMSTHVYLERDLYYVTGMCLYTCLSMSQVSVDISLYMYLCQYLHICLYACLYLFLFLLGVKDLADPEDLYGVAMSSRLLQNISLFCRI